MGGRGPGGPTVTRGTQKEREDQPDLPEVRAHARRAYIRVGGAIFQFRAQRKEASDHRRGARDRPREAADDVHVQPHVIRFGRQLAHDVQRHTPLRHQQG